MLSGDRVFWLVFMKLPFSDSQEFLKMSITPEIQDLVERLNQELGEIEQEATEGENIIQQLMSLFSNNASLI